MSIQNLVKVPSVTLIIGKTQSGKSHLLEYIIKTLYYNGYFSFGIIISSTSMFNNEHQYVDQRFHIIPEKAERYLKILMVKMAQYKQQKININGFIVLDDCLGSLKWNAELWTRLACTARHYNLSVFIITQYLNKVPSVI